MSTSKANGRPNTDATPDHDNDAEQAVLGALLLNPTIADELTLTANDFYNPHHATIWHTITALHTEGHRPDPITVADRLTATGQLSKVGGGPYLHTLLAAVPTTANAGYYAAILHRHTRTRAINHTAARLHHAATIDDQDQQTRLIRDLTGELDTLTTPGPEHAPTGTDTWAPVDLQPALTGGILTPPPVLLARTDGAFLLYLGRLHSLSGEPEAGKTWVALLAVYQAISDGQHVIYLDFEDTPEGIVARLLALGAHPTHIAQRLHYIRPDRPTDPPARRQLAQLVEANFTTLVIVDGVTEAMTLHGLEPYDNSDTAKFYETLPRAITRLPHAPAVLLIDHVPKDKDRPKRYAIGAQHKLAGLDGAAYICDIIKPFAPGQPGISRITIAKDRPGQVRAKARGGIIADLHIGGETPVVTAELRPPLTSSVASTPDRHWRPTILMEKVSRWLEINPAASLVEIEKGVRGRSANLRAAVEALVLEKFIDRQTGEKGRISHYSKEPFRDTPESEEIDNDMP